MVKRTCVWNGGKQMKPMLPTLQFDAPIGKEWCYEIKYDGFRAFLIWDQQGIQLLSRNGKDLSKQFPEVTQFLLERKNDFYDFIPFTLDGELVLLENGNKSNFNQLQVRGRLKSTARIAEAGNKLPARLLAFDLLKWKGKDMSQEPYINRKEALMTLFTTLALPLEPSVIRKELVQMIPYERNFSTKWEQVILYDGEGVVAKQKESTWEHGKRTRMWVKYKNWKHVSCFITAYDKENGYFSVAVYKNEQIYTIGQFIFGLKQKEKQVLTNVIQKNKTGENEQFIYVPPAICVEIKYLSVYNEQFREPHFHSFRLDLTANDCTYERFIAQQKNFPNSVQITHPDKLLWHNNRLTKLNYLDYLRTMSPYMLPFLHNRVLTVIRYPHGMFGEAFFQKNCPDYAPEYIKRVTKEGIDYIVCNDLKTLLWLGNQLAIEFHVPFSTIEAFTPTEIVFDLDPPSQNEFQLAVEAALILKEVFDQLQLMSFIKTSGNKGLQIYIPLPDNRYSFADTRLFTSFIADYLISKDPTRFTTERLKKNRRKRLYVDYIQHAEGKTIIAPYSPRGTKHATVATPLYWEEVNEQLTPSAFTITNVRQRVQENGCPFATFSSVKKSQNFDPVLSFLKQQHS